MAQWTCNPVPAKLQVHMNKGLLPLSGLPLYLGQLHVAGDSKYKILQSFLLQLIFAPGPLAVGFFAGLFSGCPYSSCLCMLVRKHAQTSPLHTLYVSLLIVALSCSSAVTGGRLSWSWQEKCT